MLKKFTYQKERVFTFTDAVFSIAITLLVLEITIPAYGAMKEYGIGSVLQKLIPDFIGFLVSFLVIALYWKFYLLYSRYISKFDSKLMSLNTFMLLSVALLPFSTGFFVANINFLGPFTFYCGNLVLLGLFMYIMLVIVLRRAKVQIDPVDASYLKFRGILAVVFWLILFVFSCFYTHVPVYCIPLIFVFQRIGKAYYNRKSSKAARN